MASDGERGGRGAFIRAMVFGWRRHARTEEDLSKERTNERATTFLPSFFLSFFPYRFPETILPLQRPLEMDPGISLFPLPPSVPPYISLHRKEGERASEGGREGEPKSAESGIWMLQRQPFLAAVAVTLRASS